MKTYFRMTAYEVSREEWGQDVLYSRAKIPYWEEEHKKNKNRYWLWKEHSYGGSPCPIPFPECLSLSPHIKKGGVHSIPDLEWWGNSLEHGVKGDPVQYWQNFWTEATGRMSWQKSNEFSITESPLKDIHLLWGSNCQLLNKRHPWKVKEINENKALLRKFLSILPEFLYLKRNEETKFMGVRDN